MARVVPEGVRVPDPDHVRVPRDDLGFVQDIDPAGAVEAASRHLPRLVDERGEELRSPRRRPRADVPVGARPLSTR
ncbi:hypothetical protein ACFZAG_29290 [Streptomyces sp. NPDC012403]|uniref:hypothetical protein n=1 Tax=Streptomyces sp. NPDC012403 TaxID=3364831 RepID=UPI0036E5F4C7